MTAHVSALAVHPLKSGRGLPREEVVVDRCGVRGDRRWMVQERDGRMVSARKDPRLLLVDAVTDEDGLTLSAPGLPSLRVVEPREAPYVHGELWGDDVRGRPAGPEADAWLAALLGRDGLRLVWCDDPTYRPVDPDHGRPGETVVFQDGYPLLLATTATLARVQEWVDAAAQERGEETVRLVMERFRPNVVVDGLDEPLVEQDWREVRLGATTYRMAKHCGRCVMTTYDPVTLARGKEPLRSLARHNTVDGRIVFGVNLVPVLGPGEQTVLRVGDEAVPLD